MLHRGEVWWVRLDPTRGSEIAKTHPCLVLSTDILNAHRRTVVVIPFSTSPQSRPPVLVPVVCAGRKVVAVIDQVRAVAKERFDNIIEMIAPEYLEAIEQALGEILEIR
jgi:mRNA interferase MazF